MAAKVEVKTTFQAARTIEPTYTGGDLSLDASGQFLASCVEDDVLVVRVRSGQRLARLEGDGEPVTSLCISPSASHLVICSRSLSMRIYKLDPRDDIDQVDAKLQRTLKPHNSPVVTTTIDASATLLAAGCADGTTKVFDLNGGFTTHTLHGHGGVVSCVKFFQLSGTDPPKYNQLSRKRSNDGKLKRHSANGNLDAGYPGFYLASGSEDGKIRIWDLQKRKVVANLDSHVSIVRDLDYSAKDNTLLSTSRDKTIIIWDCQTWKARKVIPVLEVVEAAGFIADGSICYSGGEFGRLRLWDPKSGRELTKEQGAGIENDSILAIEHPSNADYVLTVHIDQTLRLHSLGGLTLPTNTASLDPLPILQRVSGNHDEVIDLARLGADRSLLALATNTESIRVISLATSPADDEQSFGADVTLLEGHSDIVICLDVDWSGHWLATGAKDNTARLWRIDPGEHTFACVAIFTGHAESLGAISLPRSPPPTNTSASNDPLNYPPAFLLTGSQDRTVKRWETSKIKVLSENPEPQSGLRALFTRVAHEKDINALDVSPISSIFASASQDRTIKIWSLEDGSVMGILRGHKRGVWSIRFAPKETPLINTVEGHSSSSRGVIVSGSGDRTVKVWSLSTYTCLLTFEGHSNSVLKVVWLYPPVSSQSAEDDDGEELNLREASSYTSTPLIASASSDSLIKIWSPFTKTQSSTSSSDSLTSPSLLTTLDNHTDRVWALASHPFSPSITKKPSSNENMISCNPYPLISGSADATITCWTDTTTATSLAATQRAAERVEQDQALQNHIHSKNYREVVVLCLQLNHPGRLLKVFQDVLAEAAQRRDRSAYTAQWGTRDSNSDSHNSKEEDFILHPEIDHILSNLSPYHLRLLLLRLRDWNTNARTAPVAQKVLYCLLRTHPVSHFIALSRRGGGIGRGNEASTTGPDDIPSMPNGKGTIENANANLKDIFRALEVYTARHYSRVEELLDESYLVEYTIGEMDEVLGGGK